MVKKRLIPKLGLAAIALALALFGPETAQADTLCRTYPTEAGKLVGPMGTSGDFGGITAGSFSVEIVSGSGAVGSYQLQRTNGRKFFNEGSVVSSEGITTFTPSTEFYQILMTVGPDSGTVVYVCLHVH